MELVLKLPKNKPPFICILFKEEFTAARTNQAWVNSYRDDTYQLILEASQKLLLTLISSINKGVKYELAYNPVDLLKFIVQTKDCNCFNFGHIVCENNIHKIVRTSVNQRPFVLKVNQVKVLTE